jgi:bifunctional UDP-N-acetylglucosamine pyrophosphorylase / glucosamine-1-phosphate N-acetyltransferase
MTRADVVAIVLAAGQGTRMKSELPKVMHPLLGRPMLSYPVLASLDAGAARVVCVVGHGAEMVTRMLAERFDARVSTALQPAQRGTGDAARCGAEALPGFAGWLLILYGDSALLTSEALSTLMASARAGNGPLALLTTTSSDATGYGRILRDAQGHVIGIREQKDCSAEEAKLREWNPGVYAIRGDFFSASIGKLTTNNAQGELYLTDLVAMAASQGGVTAVPWDEAELLGANDRHEFVQRERELARRIARAHMKAGVTLRDGDDARIEPSVVIEADAVIERNVELRGNTVIGRGARIDVGCVLTDTRVGEGAVLLPYSVASESVIGGGARIGPFAHLRPGTELAADVHIGNFVETKKTRVGEGSKANHLAYLGDGEIGRGVNVGAGTIFCNYDGVNKHTTTLEDGAFIGSDSQLVAPVRVGKNAYVATGTTVTSDVPEDALAIGRTRQENKPGLAARLRRKLEADKARKAGR